jgi:hypothetical protein
MLVAKGTLGKPDMKGVDIYNVSLKSSPVGEF